MGIQCIPAVYTVLHTTHIMYSTNTTNPEMEISPQPKISDPEIRSRDQIELMDRSDEDIGVMDRMESSPLHVMDTVLVLLAYMYTT